MVTIAMTVLSRATGRLPGAQFIRGRCPPLARRRPGLWWLIPFDRRTRSGRDAARRPVREDRPRWGLVPATHDRPPSSGEGWRDLGRGSERTPGLGADGSARAPGTGTRSQPLRSDPDEPGCRTAEDCVGEATTAGPNDHLGSASFRASRGVVPVTCGCCRESGRSGTGGSGRSGESSESSESSVREPGSTGASREDPAPRAGGRSGGVERRAVTLGA